MMMKRNFILTSIFFFFYLAGYTQNDSIPIMKRGVNFEVIGNSCNLDKLNKALNTAGFNEISNYLNGLSIGMYSRILDGNSYGTINFTWLEAMSKNQENNNPKARIDVFELSTEFNHIITKSSKWLLYPNIGFGLSMSKLKLMKDTTFAQSISNLSNQANYVNEYPLMFANIGFGVERRFQILYANYYLGFDVGYRLSTKSGWGYESSPKTGYSGFEFKLKFRFESNVSQRKYLRQSKA